MIATTSNYCSTAVVSALTAVCFACRYMNNTDMNIIYIKILLVSLLGQSYLKLQ